MAKIACFGTEIVCISGNKISIYDLTSGSSRLIECPKPQITEAEKHKKKPEGTEEGSDRILACCFSPRGSYFATCDDVKRLTLWRVTSPAWTQVSTRQLARRCTSIAFTQTENMLLVADKSGDVFSFSITEPDQPGFLVLGHVSMLLDLCLCGGDKYLLTADRDEKIRVSSYPNGHSIHGFCLAHTQFVSRLAYFNEEDILVSASGDGTLRLWDYVSCRLLHTRDCRELVTCDKRPPSSDERPRSKGHDYEEEADLRAQARCLAICHQHGLVAVTFDRDPDCLVFKLVKTSDASQYQLTLLSTLTLTAPAWDLTFDVNGHLLVLQKTSEKPLVIHQYDAATNEMAPVLEGGDAQMERALVAVNGSSAFYTDSLGVESIFSSLHKAKIDNMTEYIERKLQRIHGKNKSSPAETADEANSEAVMTDEAMEPKTKMLKTQ